MHEIEKYCNEKFKALNDEYEAKVKSMEDDHEKSLKMLRQPPSPTLCDQSLQTLPVQLTNRSQQTAPENFSDDSMQTPAISFADLPVQTEPIDEELGPDGAEAVAVVALQAKLEQLKKEVAELVFENNRYHFAISYCTFCALEDDTSDASTFLDTSIRASTPVSSKLPSSDPDPALLSFSIFYSLFCQAQPPLNSTSTSTEAEVVLISTSPATHPATQNSSEYKATLLFRH